MIELTPKQRQVWRESVLEPKRWNISQGAVRSGKTYLDYYKIPHRIRTAPQGLILLLGNTRGTLERNILDPMRDIWSSGFVGTINSQNKVNLFGRECYALGAEKVSQVNKIRGAGLAYAYGDEITTWNEEVFRMLQSRLDRGVFDGTCNPDHPKHWLKEFLDSDADIYQQTFRLDDNTIYARDNPGYIEHLKKEYAGTVYYDRLIEGLWVAAEGIIYRLFADDTESYLLDQKPDIMFSTIGVDFGGSKSATAFNCTAVVRHGIVTLDDEHIPDELSPAQLDRRFVEFVRRQIDQGHKVTEIRADSAEQILIRGLRAALAQAGIGLPIKNAVKGPINDRIKFYIRLMGAGAYKIMRNCEATIDAFKTALWNSKTLKDERLDDGTTNIDSLDAQEYTLERYHKQIINAIGGVYG